MLDVAFDDLHLSLHPVATTLVSLKLSAYVGSGFAPLVTLRLLSACTGLRHLDLTNLAAPIGHLANRCKPPTYHLATLRLERPSSHLRAADLGWYAARAMVEEAIGQLEESIRPQVEVAVGELSWD